MADPCPKCGSPHLHTRKGDGDYDTRCLCCDYRFNLPHHSSPCRLTSTCCCICKHRWEQLSFGTRFPEGYCCVAVGFLEGGAVVYTGDFAHGLCELFTPITPLLSKPVLSIDVATTLYRHQTEYAIRWYYRHRQRVDGLVSDCQSSDRPPRGIERDFPDEWSSENWKWFLAGVTNL